MEGLQGLGIGGRDVGGPLDGLQVAVLGPDARVVQPRGYAVGLGDLPVVILEHQGLGAVEHTGAPLA